MTTRYTVVLSKLAQEQFSSFIRTNRKLGEQLAHAIDRLASHPALGTLMKGEWQGYRKYRTGDYRIVYRVEHARLIIFIIRIGDRKDVYR